MNDKNEVDDTKIGEMTLTPNHFSNTGKVIDHDEIIKAFNVEKIKPEQITRFEKLIGQKVHPLFQKGIFFSHRGFDVFLDFVEKKKPIYLYTGRGPSSDSMHLGHLLPFIVTKWMQDVLDCPMVIQMSDDEKYFYQKSDYLNPDNHNVFYYIINYLYFN